MAKQPLFEGDSILLFCDKAKGFVFSPPPLSSSISSLSIHCPPSSDCDYWTYPGLTNINDAAFRVYPANTQLTSNCCPPHVISVSHHTKIKKLTALVFGRKIYLFHVASKRYLSFNKDAIYSQKATLVEWNANGSDHSQRKQEQSPSTVIHSISMASSSDEMVASAFDVNDTGSNHGLQQKLTPTVFCIIPSDFSTKSNGQTISLKDIVRLQFVEPGAKSQILCVPFSLALNSDYELRKASDGSDFILCSHSTVQKEVPQAAPRGGDIVMFQNEKQSAFITVINSEVKAKVVGGSHTGTVFAEWTNFWQIENQAIQYDSNRIGHNGSWFVRIKHWLSKCYLALNTKNDIKLVEIKDGRLDKELDEMCTFSFEGDFIEPHSLLNMRYVLLRHVKSNCYITVDGNDSTFEGGESFFKISPEPLSENLVNKRNQYFWIKEINETMLRDFSTLHGTLMSLKMYIDKCCHSPLFSTDKLNVGSILTTTLNELQKWMRTERESRWPDMWRAIKGIEFLVEFCFKVVRLPDQPYGENKKQWIGFVLNILKSYIKLGSEESLKYLLSTDIIKTLFQLIEYHDESKTVLCALMQSHFFRKDQEEEALQQVINAWEPALTNFTESHTCRLVPFIKCFSALCRAGGQPVMKIQKKVVNDVIIPANQKGLLFLKIDDELDPVLLEQIKLYRSVCLGVNLYCIDEMVKILSYETAYSCSKSRNCEDLSLKRAFYKYLVVSLVQKNVEESGTNLENMWHSYNWSKFTRKCVDCTTCHDKDLEERRLKPDCQEKQKKCKECACCQDCNHPDAFSSVGLSGLASSPPQLSNKGIMMKLQHDINELLNADKKDQSEADHDLITQKLSVLETLVDYGFYWIGKHAAVGGPRAISLEEPDDDAKPTTDPKTVVKNLINTLGNMKDNPQPHGIKAKIKIIRILQLFLHQTYYLATSRLIYDYYYLFHEPEEGRYFNKYDTPNDQLKILVNSSRFKICQTLKKYVLKRLRWILYEERVSTYDSSQSMAAVHAKNHQVEHQTTIQSPLLNEHEDYEYQCLNVYDTEQFDQLKTLLMKFIGSQNDDDLSISAFGLLFDLCQGEVVMFEKQPKIILKSSSDYDIYSTSIEYACFKDESRILLKLIHGNISTTELHIEDYKALKKFVYEIVVHSCGTQPVIGRLPRDETFSSKTDQDLFVTTGVLGLLMKYIVKYAPSHDDTQDGVVKAVCDAIISVIRNNNDAKRIVFSRFQDLLKARQGVQSVAHLLTEVLTDNIELCCKLPMPLVELLFSKATTMNGEGCLEFMPTLEAWMKVSKSGFPNMLKKHQQFVTSLIDKHLKDAHHNLTKLHNCDSVVQLLKDSNKNDQFVCLMHLLAVCTEGIHKYSEDIARAFLDISSLSRILNDESLPFESRLPFVMIMTESFITAEQESQQSVIKLSCDRYVWEHVKTMTEWLKQINEKLSELTKSKDMKSIVACQAIKIKMIFSCHMTHTFWKNHQLSKIIDRELKFDEVFVRLRESDRTSQPVAILYQYVIEGLLPMLSAFAEEYSKMQSSLYEDIIKGNEGDYSWTNELIQFGIELKNLVKNYPEIFVTSELQKQFFEAKLKPILVVSKDKKDHLEKSTLVVSEYKIRESGDLDKEQAKINKQFNEYRDNFKKVLFHQEENLNLCFEKLFASVESLYPSRPGFLQLMKYFCQLDRPYVTIEDIKPLANLLRILHKRVMKSMDDKNMNSMIERMISIVQVLSYSCYSWSVHAKPSQLKIFQDDIFNTCVLVLSHDNKEIILQIFGLLTRLTINANENAQDQVFKVIVSNSNSIFCQRVYSMLENATATFSEIRLNHFTQQEQVQVQHSPHWQKQQQQHQQEGLDSFDNAIRSAGIVLECISALCDGQYKKTQQYLLNQNHSWKKLDIIESIAILLRVLTEEFENNLSIKTDIPKRAINYLVLIWKTLQALIETTSGNFNNQEAVFRCQITDTISNLLHCLIFTEIPPVVLMEIGEQQEITVKKNKEIMLIKEKLNTKAFELLRNLLEETDTRSQSLIYQFIEDVDLNVIVQAVLYWENIEAYHILRLVADNKNINVDALVGSDIKDKYKELWDMFRERSRCIEVMYKPDRHNEDKTILTRVYFDYDPLNEFTGEEKDTVTHAILEETQEKSLVEFNAWGKALRNRASWLLKLKNGFSEAAGAKWKLIFSSFFEISKAPRHLILIILTVLMNILTLPFLRIPDDRTFNETGEVHNWVLYPDVPYLYFPVFLSVLGIIHAILSVLMYAEFIMKEWPNFTVQGLFFVIIAKNIRKLLKWTKVTKAKIKDFKARNEARSSERWQLKNTLEYEQIKLKVDLEDNTVNHDETSTMYNHDDGDKYFKIDCFGFESVYRLVFMICSLIAIPLRGYPYCICLFYVFLKVDVVEYMLTALAKARKQLCFVFLIAAAILLLFAIGAFIFIHDFFDPSTSLFCNTLWECYISVSREGLLDTVGLAIPFTIPLAQGNRTTPSYNNYALRSLFFDIPFFIVVTTIILNIVTAVLIDRFSDLREKREKVKTNKKKSCFICGYEAEKFEREAKGFTHHVKEDHNKWNYIYYLIYLDRKAKNDHTALEKQIGEINSLQKNCTRIDHYPIRRAKVIKEKEATTTSEADMQDPPTYHITSLTSRSINEPLAMDTQPLTTLPPTQYKPPHSCSLESPPPTQSHLLPPD